MSKKQNFLLMSLEDERAQKIANILSNKSCSKILDFLTENEATESEIAKKLNLPISTVHYNLQQLLKAELIIWEKYHYSEKGKEVKHYTVANKYIIITPKGKSEGFLDKIKSIIPTFFLIGIGAGIINWYNNIKSNTLMASTYQAEVVQDAAPEMFRAKAIIIENSSAQGIEMMADNVGSGTINESFFSNYLNVFYEYWFWFIIGAIFGVTVYLLIDWIRKKIKGKNLRKINK